MTLKTFRFALLVTPLAVAVAGCAGANAAQKPHVEVTFQASTDISDDGAQINGKLCFRETHWELTPVPNGAGTVDLLGVNRHFIVGRLSANENRVVDFVMGLGDLRRVM